MEKTWNLGSSTAELKGGKRIKQNPRQNWEDSIANQFDGKLRNKAAKLQFTTKGGSCSHYQRSVTGKEKRKRKRICLLEFQKLPPLMRLTWTLKNVGFGSWESCSEMARQGERVCWAGVGDGGLAEFHTSDGQVAEVRARGQNQRDIWFARNIRAS